MASEVFSTMEKVNFFDAAAANKRNSLLLIFGMSLLFFFALAVLSYAFRFGLFGLVMGFFFLLFYALIVYFQGDSIILMMSGAKEVPREEQPFLYNVVEGLALAAQIPMPKVYMINDAAPNAFATGRDPKHSSVAVTTGLLSIMKREELEGVLAHEISHIANYDVRFSMIAVVFAGAIAMLADFALRFALFGGGRRDRDRDGGGGIILLLGLVFMILAPLFATFVRLALSRQREYLADANGARMTRYPEGLASALEKISKKPIPTKSATESTASLYFSNPFPNAVFSLMATHPPIEERIKRLRGM